VFVHNKLLLPQKLWPTGLGDLAEKVRANPAVFKRKIASYNPLVSPFAYQIYWSLIRHHADAFWPAIQTIGPSLKFEQTTGAIVDKVITGEYVLGIYLPETLVPTLDAQRARILAVTMPDDGTPMSPRSMGVMSKGQSPNAAKLLVDFLLSREGQVAIAKGGTLAYWPGIDQESGAVSYPTLQQRAKSERSFAEVSFDPAMETRRAEIGERLRKAFGQ
jgi:iron(III) transport system substrate-binding protein